MACCLVSRRLQHWQFWLAYDICTVRRLLLIYEHSYPYTPTYQSWCVPSQRVYEYTNDFPLKYSNPICGPNSQTNVVSCDTLPYGPHCLPSNRQISVAPCLFSGYIPLFVQNPIFEMAALTNVPSTLIMNSPSDIMMSLEFEPPPPRQTPTLSV